MSDRKPTKLQVVNSGKDVKIRKQKQYNPKPAQQPSVDNYGWDTVYAMRFAQINQAIATTGASPETFDQSDPEPPATADFRISGSFGDWRLATGGSKSLVCMELPIPSLRYEDYDGNVDDTYTDVTATISLRLEDIPQPSSDNASVFRKPGNVVEIRFPQGGKNNADVVASVTTSYTGPEPSATAQIVINSLLQIWLNKNCQDFNMVFATINLNAEAGKDDFNWMMPSHVAYAVRDDIFAVLCMTQDRTPSPTRDVSPDIIPVGQQSGFLISPRRYLQNVILPNVYLMFDGASPADFTLRDDKAVLENNKQIKLSELRDEKDNVFQPIIDARKFTMEIQGNELKMDIEDMHYSMGDWMGGYEVRMDTTSFGAANLESSGHLTVLMTDGDTEVTLDNSLTRDIVQIAVPVVASIAAAVLAFAAAGAVAGGAAAAGQASAQGGASAAGQAAGQAAAQGTIPRLGALIGAIVCTVGAGGWVALDLILNAQAKQKALNSPTLDTLLQDAVGSVQWPLGTNYEIKSAVFNHGLQIGIEHQQAKSAQNPVKEVSNA